MVASQITATTKGNPEMSEEEIIFQHFFSLELVTLFAFVGQTNLKVGGGGVATLKRRTS